MSLITKKRTMDMNSPGNDSVKVTKQGNYFQFQLNNRVLDSQIFKDDLTKGVEYQLDSGDTLKVQLKEFKGTEEVLITKNGIPLPDSDHHPQKRLRQFRLFTLIPLVCFFVFLMGLVVLDIPAPRILDRVSFAMALALIPCGFFLLRGSKVALSLLIILVVTDFLLTIFSTFTTNQAYLISFIGIKALLLGPLFYAFSLWNSWQLAKQNYSEALAQNS